MSWRRTMILRAKVMSALLCGVWLWILLLSCGPMIRPPLINRPGVRRLTSQLGIHKHPSWSSDGSSIVFSSAVSEEKSADIFAMSIYGDNLRRLTNNDVDDRYPTWSPDGTTIAFVSRHSGAPPAIYTMNTNGTNVTRLVEGGMPAWSPDGRKIAFCAGTGDDIEIYVWEQGHITQLTKNSYLDMSPSWSPDGSRIVFTSTRDVNKDGRIDYLDPPHLYVMRSDGSEQQQLTTGLHYDHSPAWSPDGHWIVYSSYLAEGPDSIYLISADGTQRQLLLDEPDCGDFAWSPDGSQLAFSKGILARDVYIMDVNTVMGANSQQ